MQSLVVSEDFSISPLPGGGIKPQVQLQNIHARLSHEAPLPPLRVGSD
jgi:hypothetical protein